MALTRAVNRTILPREWKFESTALGKPFVRTGLPEVSFSVSHVDQIAAVAVSSSLKVGIDVESTDQPIGADVIAAFCHGDEQRSLNGLRESQRTREFVRLWTLKEAYTKLLGTGHSVDFTRIKFLLDPVNLQASGELSAARTVFENFYITARRSLYHATLALELARGMGALTEVQIIVLADPAGLEEAIPAPVSDLMSDAHSPATG